MKKLVSLMLSLALCLSLFTVTVSASDNTSTKEPIETRAGGGSGVRFVKSSEEFTIPVQGSGMRTIIVEVTGTNDANTVFCSVTPPGRNGVNFTIYGNDRLVEPVFPNLPAGNYTVYAHTTNYPAVVAVYIQ